MFKCGYLFPISCVGREAKSFLHLNGMQEDEANSILSVLHNGFMERIGVRETCENH